MESNDDDFNKPHKVSKSSPQNKIFSVFRTRSFVLELQRRANAGEKLTNPAEEFLQALRGYTPQFRSREDDEEDEAEEENQGDAGNGEEEDDHQEDDDDEEDAANIAYALLCKRSPTLSRRNTPIPPESLLPQAPEASDASDGRSCSTSPQRPACFPTHRNSKQRQQAPDPATSKISLISVVSPRASYMSPTPAADPRLADNGVRHSAASGRSQRVGTYGTSRTSTSLSQTQRRRTNKHSVTEPAGLRSEAGARRSHASRKSNANAGESAGEEERRRGETSEEEGKPERVHRKKKTDTAAAQDDVKEYVRRHAGHSFVRSTSPAVSRRGIRLPAQPILPWRPANKHNKHEQYKGFDPIPWSQSHLKRVRTKHPFSPERVPRYSNELSDDASTGLPSLLRQFMDSLKSTGAPIESRASNHSSRSGRRSANRALKGSTAITSSPSQDEHSSLSSGPWLSTSLVNSSRSLTTTQSQNVASTNNNSVESNPVISALLGPKTSAPESVRKSAMYRGGSIPKKVSICTNTNIPAVPAVAKTSELKGGGGGVGQPSTTASTRSPEDTFYRVSRLSPAARLQARMSRDSLSAGAQTASQQQSVLKGSSRSATSSVSRSSSGRATKAGDKAGSMTPRRRSNTAPGGLVAQSWGTRPPQATAQGARNSRIRAFGSLSVAASALGRSSGSSSSEAESDAGARRLPPLSDGNGTHSLDGGTAGRSSRNQQPHNDQVPDTSTDPSTQSQQPRRPEPPPMLYPMLPSRHLSVNPHSFRRKLSLRMSADGALTPDLPAAARLSTLTQSGGGFCIRAAYDILNRADVSRLGFNALSALSGHSISGSGSQMEAGDGARNSAPVTVVANIVRGRRLESKTVSGSGYLSSCFENQDELPLVRTSAVERTTTSGPGGLQSATVSVSAHASSRGEAGPLPKIGSTSSQNSNQQLKPGLRQHQSSIVRRMTRALGTLLINSDSSRLVK